MDIWTCDKHDKSIHKFKMIHYPANKIHASNNNLENYFARKINLEKLEPGRWQRVHFLPYVYCWFLPPWDLLHFLPHVYFIWTIYCVSMSLHLLRCLKWKNLIGKWGNKDVDSWECLLCHKLVNFCGVSLKINAIYL